MKYIDADLLRKEINKWTDAMSDNIEDDYSDGVRFALNHFVFVLESLQQEQKDIIVLNKKDWEKQEQFRKDKKFGTPLQKEQPEKYIKLNGIKYKEVPAKTNDKICKDCDYFLDNGKCELVDCCPCIDDDTILERLPEQSEVDLEEEVKKYFGGLWPGIKTAEQCNTDMHFTPPAIMRLAEYFYKLGLNAKGK